MNDFPIFPKVGYHLKFKQSHGLMTNHGTGAYGNDIQPGEVAEVVALSVEAESGEFHKYILYLGLSNNRVIKFNYTVNAYKVDLIPNSPAAQILYG